MSDTLSGVYIEYEYITLVRVAQESGAIENMEIVPLDTMESHEKSVLEGLRQLKKSGTFIKGEPVHVAFQSEQTIFFQTELSPLVEDVHEAMSWELMNRTDLPLDQFTFVSIALGENRAMGVAQPISEVKRYTNLLKKVGLKPASLGLNLISIVNLMEVNYGAGKETILFHVSAPTSYVIYVKDGMLWDVRLIYGLDEAVTPDELVPQLIAALTDLKRSWNISDELLTKMSGSLISNVQVRTDLVKYLPNCYELNCFERIENQTGNDTDTIMKFNPIVSVAAGLAISEVAR